MPKSVSPNGRGTIWAWPSTMASKNDQWCRDNTIRPVLSMQAHSAPLGITFFNYSNSSTSADDCPDDGGFPKSMNGNAFIAFHGCWNRNPPTGYKVVRVPMGDNGNPTVDEAIDFFCHHDKSGSGAKWPNGFRPVDVVFDKCNRLLITSDGTGSASTRKGNGIVIVTYNGGGNSGSINSPSPSASNNGVSNCKLCNVDGEPDPLINIIIIIVVCVFTCICFSCGYFLYNKRRKRNKEGSSIISNIRKNEVHDKPSGIQQTQQSGNKV